MGGTIAQIGNAVTNAANDVKKNPGGALAGVGLGSMIGAGVPGMVLGGLAGAAEGNEGVAPSAPGEDPAMAKLRAQQMQNAKEFRANMPNMQREMGENLKTTANQGLSAANKNTNEGMSSRGLLYSNLNKGAQAGNRSRTQAGVAKGTSDINTGLMNAANTLDTQAIETGVGIQQTQQAIQNDIYSQAMAKMNAQNAQAGGLMGLAGTAGMLAALA